MNLKKFFLILCCLSATACATESPEPADTTAAEPPAAAGTAPAATGDEAPPPLGQPRNVVVPDNTEVTITKNKDMTAEEYRVGGRLYMIKITPRHGKPYYLIDEHGDGRFARRAPSTFMVHPPMWVIKKF